MNTQSIAKVRVSLSIAVLTVCAAAIAPHVQAQAAQGRVNIPFSFQSGSQHLSPGTYTFSMENGAILKVSGARESTFAMVRPEETTKPAQTGKIVFHKYGDRYILHAVWVAGRTSHLECVRTKLEKELQLASVKQNSTGMEVAELELPR